VKDLLIGALLHESRRLTSIQNALLPRLVTGRLRVPESYAVDEQLASVIRLADQAEETVAA